VTNRYDRIEPEPARTRGGATPRCDPLGPRITRAATASCQGFTRSIAPLGRQSSPARLAARTTFTGSAIINIATNERGRPAARWWRNGADRPDIRRWGMFRVAAPCAPASPRSSVPRDAQPLPCTKPGQQGACPHLPRPGPRALAVREDAGASKKKS
jgi:hypothetical protein